MRISTFSKPAIFILLLAMGMPGAAVAYDQSYYQSSYYSQSYYQSTYYSQSSYGGYAQSYYQSTYQTVFTSDTAALDDFDVAGAVSKSSGTFVIDHPLDPANLLLFHSFVESPEVKNLYDGTTLLDGGGEASVRLPAYFEALNKDFRYQLKPIDKPMPNLYVKEEVKNNRFVIGGGVPGGWVSWQVSGVRHDPYILANPIIPEVEKGPEQLAEKGEYLFDGYEQRAVWPLISPFLWLGEVLSSWF
jgi:hypothetical protein